MSQPWAGLVETPPGERLMGRPVWRGVDRSVGPESLAGLRVPLPRDLLVCIVLAITVLAGCGGTPTNCDPVRIATHEPDVIAWEIPHAGSVALPYVADYAAYLECSVLDGDGARQVHKGIVWRAGVIAADVGDGAVLECTGGALYVEYARPVCGCAGVASPPP